jgi:hypothetical protein
VPQIPAEAIQPPDDQHIEPAALSRPSPDHRAPDAVPWPR